MDFFNQPLELPIQKIESDLLLQKQVGLSILRLDKTDNAISGNKFFKLKYNLIQAQKEQKDTILTFGGAFSNHIAAVAAVGKTIGKKTIGIIRGEEHYPLNSTLKMAMENGMEIHYLDRTTYRLKHTPEVLKQLELKFGDFYLIPEGGTNDFAIQGTKEIVHFIPDDIDTICCPIGTGGTIAGIIQNTKRSVLGFSALKGDFVTEMVNQLLSQKQDNWKIIQDFHFGGFAKTKPELLNFINQFDKAHSIPLEQIYTGKMMYGIMELVKQDYFSKNTKLLAIHTGGLQGALPSLKINLL